MKTGKIKNQLIASRFQIACAVVASLATCQMANASLTISSVVGGSALSGEYYANFDALTPTSSGFTGSVYNSGGLSVAVTANGAVVSGSSSGVYAAPYLTGNNNQYFGGPGIYTGSDTTTYLTAGSDGQPGFAGANVILTFAAQQNYLGLLWGSVDAYNTLKFYDGANQVGIMTGSDVLAPANGYQGDTGTAYVNITGITFDKVVATSSDYAFEFDNVAYSAVPEPNTIMAGALMLLPFGASTLRILRKNRNV